jgi:hypothetical protein
MTNPDGSDGFSLSARIRESMTLMVLTSSEQVLGASAHRIPPKMDDPSDPSAGGCEGARMTAPALPPALRFALLDIADRISRLEFSVSDPSRFAHDRSELAHELRTLARGEPVLTKREKVRAWRAQ